MVSVGQLGVALRLSQELWDKGDRPGTDHILSLLPDYSLRSLAVFECSLFLSLPIALVSVWPFYSGGSRAEPLAGWGTSAAPGHVAKPGAFLLPALSRPQHHLHRRVLCQPGRLPAAVGWLYL